MPPADPIRRQLASDNYAGICPEAFDAMAAANRLHPPGHGDDASTAATLRGRSRLQLRSCSAAIRRSPSGVM